MDDLREIVMALNTKEIYLVENYYNSQNGNKSNKRLKLFTSIKDNKELQRTSKTSSAFSHLKRRLKQDILGLILFNNNSIDSDSSIEKIKILCQRLKIQAEILITREAFATGIKLLNESLKLAFKHELHEEKIALIELIKKHFINPHTIMGFESYNFSYYKKQEFCDPIEAAKECRLLLLNSNIFTKERTEFDVNIASSTYEKLKMDNKDGNLINFRYWYLYVEICNDMMISKDYTKVLNNIEKLSNLIKSEPKLFSVFQKRENDVLVAVCFLHLGKYNLVRSYIHKVFYDGGSSIISRLQAYEILFLANFYEQKYEEANKVINDCSQNSDLNIFNTTAEKWAYFKANLDFIKGDYTNSMRLLGQIKLLTKYKTSWSIGLKLLEILNYIEKQYYDLADHKLYAFRQFLRRNRGFKSQRYECISEILNKISSYNYDFNKAIESYTTYFNILKLNRDCKWDSYCFEIICFENWLEIKTKN